MREILFIEKSNEHMKIWEGARLSKEEAADISGVGKILWIEQLPKVLHDLMTQVKRVYINNNESQSIEDELGSRDLRKSRELINRYPLHKYHRSQPILRNLRMTKSAIELDLMRKAIAITKEGFESVLSMVKPNIWEYQVEATLTGRFIFGGAEGHAFHPIAASGNSACTLHYTVNNQICRDGELLLLDFGAEYAHYAADISRTIPVNGQFSERQRQVYATVLDMLKKTRSLMVPGMTMEEMNRKVGEMMNHALVDLELLDKKDLQDLEPHQQPYRKYFMHGVAHHLGLDVHDLSDRFAPFQAGMVLTCEPGIYIAREGIGIRLENDILITDEGPVDLTADIPIEIEEIESLMQTSRLEPV